MSSRCKNCGGILVYDIALGKVKCQHCDSTFDADSYKAATSAEEYENLADYETTMFVCPQCGAEISATEFDVVDYCMYCGSFVTLESQLTRVKRPTHIIPFAKTKMDCQKAYSSYIMRKIYAPSEFRNAKFLDGFKGIYIPFWNFDYTCGPDIIVRGEEEGDRDGNYVNVQNYETRCTLQGNIEAMVYDASSSFDDEISLRIAPFNRDKLKTFNSSYMFGFYGDIADISHEVYKNDADNEVQERLWEMVKNNKEFSESHLLDKKPDNMATDFNLKLKPSLAMLPVWFLTWRNGNRVAYSVMNGDTGEIYAEVPIDIIRYLLFSALTAIPIYFYLNANITFSASEMLGLAMFLAFFMIMLYVFELDKLVRRVMHTDDRGFLETHAEAKKASDEQVDDNFITEVWNAICELVNTSIWYILLFIIIAIIKIEFTALALVMAILGTPFYTFYRLKNNAEILKDKSVWLDVSGALGALVLSAGLLIYDPAPDLPYYCLASLCMFSVGFTAICMINRYNDLITRPLPRFFSSKGGKQNA